MNRNVKPKVLARSGITLGSIDVKFGNINILAGPGVTFTYTGVNIVISYYWDWFSL